jgi:hypothetical protein
MMAAKHIHIHVSKTRDADSKEYQDWMNRVKTKYPKVKFIKEGSKTIAATLCQVGVFYADEDKGMVSSGIPGIL